jgi:hypothetical protein
MTAPSMGSSPHLVIPLHRRLNRQVSPRARSQKRPDRNCRTRATMDTSRFRQFHPRREATNPPKSPSLSLPPAPAPGPGLDVGGETPGQRFVVRRLHGIPFLTFQSGGLLLPTHLLHLGPFLLISSRPIPPDKLDPVGRRGPHRVSSGYVSWNTARGVGDTATHRNTPLGPRRLHQMPGRQVPAGQYCSEVVCQAWSSAIRATTRAQLQSRLLRRAATSAGNAK